MYFFPVVHVKKEVDSILLDLLYNITIICSVVGTVFIIGVCVFNYTQDRRNYTNARIKLKSAYSELLEEYDCIALKETSADMPCVIKRTSDGSILIKGVSDENVEFYFQAKQCFEKHASDGLLSEKYYNRVVTKLDCIATQ